MAKSRFTSNPNLAADLARLPGVVRHLESTAGHALPAAQAIADGFTNTGAFKDSLGVDGNRLVTTDRAAWMIEFGSVNNPPYAPLRKAAEQVGARMVDRG